MMRLLCIVSFLALLCCHSCGRVCTETVHFDVPLGSGLGMRLKVLADEDKVIVQNVQPRRPAFKLGIEKGREVETIGGEPVRGLLIDQVTSLIQRVRQSSQGQVDFEFKTNCENNSEEQHNQEIQEDIEHTTHEQSVQNDQVESMNSEQERVEEREEESEEVDDLKIEEPQEAETFQKDAREEEREEQGSWQETEEQQERMGDREDQEQAEVEDEREELEKEQQIEDEEKQEAEEEVDDEDEDVEQAIEQPEEDSNEHEQEAEQDKAEEERESPLLQECPSEFFTDDFFSSEVLEDIEFSEADTHQFLVLVTKCPEQSLGLKVGLKQRDAEIDVKGIKLALWARTPVLAGDRVRKVNGVEITSVESLQKGLAKDSKLLRVVFTRQVAALAPPPASILTVFQHSSSLDVSSDFVEDPDSRAVFVEKSLHPSVRPGDLLLRFNGIRVSSLCQLERLVEEYQTGFLQYFHGDNEKDIITEIALNEGATCDTQVTEKRFRTDTDKQHGEPQTEHTDHKDVQGNPQDVQKTPQDARETPREEEEDVHETLHEEEEFVHETVHEEQQDVQETVQEKLDDVHELPQQEEEEEEEEEEVGVQVSEGHFQIHATKCEHDSLGLRAAKSAEGQGVFIRELQNNAWERANVRAGDRIKRLNGQEIDSLSSLKEALHLNPSSLDIEFSRSISTQTPQDRAIQFKLALAGGAALRLLQDHLDVEEQNVAGSNVLRIVGCSDDFDAVQVHPGDLLWELNGRKVRTLAQAEQALLRHGSEYAETIVVLRGVQKSTFSDTVSLSPSGSCQAEKQQLNEQVTSEKLQNQENGLQEQREKELELRAKLVTKFLLEDPAFQKAIERAVEKALEMTK